MKKPIRARLIGLALALGIAATGGTVAAVVTEATPITQAEEAQAQEPGRIVYTANCPGVARSQQLVIHNYERYSSQMAMAQSIYAPLHQMYVANWFNNPDQIWTHRDNRTSWLTWKTGDIVTYEITYQRPDSGAFLAWHYWVDCFY